MQSDNYLGKWNLIPELSIYQEGKPPLRGVYEIQNIAGAIQITILWKDLEGSDHDISYAGVPDGSQQETDAPGLTHMTMSRIDENTLDTAAYKGSDCLMYARRVVSEKHDLLTTMQTSYTGEGSQSNFQVYKRAAMRTLCSIESGET